MAIYKDNTKTKDGRQWYFKVYKKVFEGNSKPYKSKRYLTKKEAQDAEALFILKKDNPVHKLFHLIAEDYIKYSYKTLKESTAYSIEGYYNNHIKNFFYNDFIDEISVRTIKDWQEYMLKKNLAIRTLNKAYTVLCNIFNFAMKEHGITSNISKLIGPFRK